MTELDLLPERLRCQSVSTKEIVLPLAAALEAIDLLETRGVRILGWEGWVKTAGGGVGIGSAPHGWSTDGLSDQAAAQLCRDTIPKAADEWAREHPDTTDRVHFCITIRAPNNSFKPTPLRGAA